MLLAVITVFICLIFLIALRLKRRENPTKWLKIRSVTEIILCAVPAVFLCILLISDFPGYRTHTKYLTSPDKKHTIIQTKAHDMFGTPKYKFYQQKGLITYDYEFDAGIGDNLNIEWQETGFVYRKKFYPYLDYFQ